MNKWEGGPSKPGSRNPVHTLPLPGHMSISEDSCRLKNASSNTESKRMRNSQCSQRMNGITDITAVWDPAVRISADWSAPRLV